MVVDQRKLDVARRALRAHTETEAVDLALDLVAFRCSPLIRLALAIRWYAQGMLS